MRVFESRVTPTRDTWIAMHADPHACPRRAVVRAAQSSARRSRRRGAVVGAALAKGPAAYAKRG